MLNSKLWHLVRLSLPWLPALITLLLIQNLHVGLPYFDSWSFVEYYQAWQQGE
jgi:hypothetical protein